MTKVNYFEVSGEQSGQEVKALKYARSKREAIELAELEGIKATQGVFGVKEMNLKTDLLPTYQMAQLFQIRQDCKDKWKDIDNTKKTQAKKVSN